MDVLKCYECGQKSVKKLAKPGRVIKFYGRECTIPEDVEIWTCLECNTEWYDQDTAEEVDRRLNEYWKMY